jgi:hypothetical protein
MHDTHTIALPRLQQAMHLVVRGFGSSEDEVRAVAGNLVEANLTGHDSHGIGMLPPTWKVACSPTPRSAWCTTAARCCAWMASAVSAR